MTIMLIAAASAILGAAAALTLLACRNAAARHRKSRARRAADKKGEKNWLRSITRFLFTTTQIAALIWVTWTYVIATYSTVALAQPFPVETLSAQAVTTILGMGALKIVGNIFEHNDGVVFGCSKSDRDSGADDESEGGIG